MSHHHSDVLKAKEVVRILEHLGFEHVRTHGSHQHFRDAIKHCGAGASRQ